MNEGGRLNGPPGQPAVNNMRSLTAGILPDKRTLGQTPMVNDMRSLTSGILPRKSFFMSAMITKDESSEVCP
jgi:hypothetical protein